VLTTRVSFDDIARWKIPSHPVDSNAFDYSVDLMPPLLPLALLVIVHHIILDLVEKPRA
jgi:hypothetical protein